MLAATLRQVAVNFRALSGLSNTSSANLTGYWREIALSSEELAGAATAANATLAGWMLRAAIAVETLEGTDGTAENPNYNGLLKRIVDAMEEGNGAVGTGSLENRLLLASNDWTGGAARIVFTGTIAEGATTGRSAGTATLANPPLDIGTLTWSELGTGTGAALFAINSSTGAVTNSSALDYETATSYTYGIQATDGVYTYTLLAPISVTDVAGDPNLDTALIAPGFTLVSAQNAYPPEFDITIDASLDVEVLSIRLQGGDEDFSTLAVNQELDPIGTGVLDFTDLAGVTTGEHFFRCRIENGTMYGPWSLVRKHGDTTAPTITSSASASAVEGVVNPTGTATANETVTWEISGGADAGLVTIDANTGAWVIAATTDYDFGQRAYVFDISCTDLAGNVSTPQTFTYTVTNNAADDPDPAWSTLSGDKSSYITLSDLNMTATVGSPPGVALVRNNTGRSTAATSIFTATVNFGSTNGTYFGFCYSNAPLSGVPGSSGASLGISLHFAAGGWEIYVGGANVENDYTGGYVDGATVSIERVGMTFRAKINGSYVGTPRTIDTGTGDLFGFFAGWDANACTADFTGY